MPFSWAAAPFTSLLVPFRWAAVPSDFLHSPVLPALPPFVYAVGHQAAFPLASSPIFSLTLSPYLPVLLPSRLLQWAIKLFPFGHIPARYLCMLAAADPRFQIAEAALEGLQPGKFAAAPGSGGGSASGASTSAGSGRGASGKGGSATLPAYPPFSGVLHYLQQAVPQLGRRPADGGELPLPPKALLAAISFLESCRRAASASSDATAAGGLTAESAAAYLLLLENALLPAAPSELHAAALAATLSVAAAQRTSFAAAYAADPGRQAVLLRLSAHVDAAARQAAAQLLGLLVAPGTAPPAQQAQQAQWAVTLCEALLSTLRAGGPDGAKHAKQEALEGAAAAAGYVAANLLQGALCLVCGRRAEGNDCAGW